MIAAFLRELDGHLRAVGVRGGAARRVLVEVESHLREAADAGEADAIRRFGAPEELARLVAAELAVRGTRLATYGVFAALALAGIGFTISLALVPAAGGWPDLFAGRFGGFGAGVGIALLLLPQIAFVSGCLALTRAVRLRRAPRAVDGELRLLRRRGAVGLGATVGALLALAAYALDFRDELATWWTLGVAILGVTLVVPLLIAAVGLARSAGRPHRRATNRVTSSTTSRLCSELVSSARWSFRSTRGGLRS
jgi:MFS family permease